MNERKPWQPHMRDVPLFNPFEPSTEWTRDIGANDRVEIPSEEDEAGAAEQSTGKEGGEAASK